ncbi:futalosine hydrolase [Thiovibrio sp. JS02]
MILLVAATEMEAAPFLSLRKGGGVELLVSGVGLLETAVRLGRRLCEGGGDVSLVLNFGVAGAYPGAGAEMLDLCLAEQEVLGDFGICHGETTEPFGHHLATRAVFSLSSSHLDQAADVLAGHGFAVKRGGFVTVHGASATASRGLSLQRAHDALCENMEGAAVARLCAEFSVPCLELRAVSNMVEDRNLANWQLAAASERCAAAVSVLLAELAIN